MTDIVNNNADFLFEKEAKKENNMLKKWILFWVEERVCGCSIMDNAKVVWNRISSFQTTLDFH